MVVAGAGRVGDEGSERKGCFSCSAAAEALDEVDETERLVFRRSRILTIACINLERVVECM